MNEDAKVDEVKVVAEEENPVVSKHSSKPSLSGRMTPPSASMGSRQSSKLAGENFNETGSMHMSNDFSNHERFNKIEGLPTAEVIKS